jgi:hypothetical protein
MSLTPQLVLFEEDHEKILAVANRLVAEAHAKAPRRQERTADL